MDFSAVGQKIKELRKQMGLSQGELASGICTQAQISKIEKGDVYPYASTLYLISQRLGVDVNYFFDIGMTPRLDYVQEVTHQLKLTRRTMNYLEMKQIVKTEQNNPLFLQNTKNYQLLLWHKGIYEYNIEKDTEKALGHLKEALSLSRSTEKVYSEREIECLLSMGVIYFEEKRYQEALSTYHIAKDHLKFIPYLTDKTIKGRLYYNIARVLTRLKNYHESIEYCEDAIKWCIEQDQLYLLGELHYHIGYNLELQENYAVALQYMKKAQLIFELRNDERFSDFILTKIEKLSSITT